MKRCDSCGAPPSAKAEPGVCLVADPFEDEFCAYCGSRFTRPATPHPQGPLFPADWMWQQQMRQAQGMQNAYGLGGISAYAGLLGGASLAQAYGRGMVGGLFG